MYRLIQDDDCHWYVIPVDKEDEFEEAINAYADGDLPFPEWAHVLGGSPGLVHFPLYRHDGVWTYGREA